MRGAFPYWAHMRFLGLTAALALPLFSGTFTITNLGNASYDTEASAINSSGGVALT